MKFVFTERFKKSYKNLSAEAQKAFHKKLELLSNDQRHPSLRTKKIQGTDNIFECSITMAVRMTWQYKGEAILLRVIGEHDDVLNKP